jgi:hypothetical protein
MTGAGKHLDFGRSSNHFLPVRIPADYYRLNECPNPGCDDAEAKQEGGHTQQ